MTGILVAGTSSDAGKSLLVTGLCRVARRRGIDVAPFKAQNMSNNSMVVTDGEIGRAQWLQSRAAGLTPSTVMNPVLLKPGSDRRSFVVLRGQPAGELRSGEYATGRAHLREAAWAAFEELRATHDLVLCEGAGSPAEVNLREGDYTNMGLARQFDLPVVLVGDIDRGGVLASIFGTHGLLDDADRALLAGYVINKFRGDQAILDPGLDLLTARTGLANLGVLPWLPGMWIDREDTLEVGHYGTAAEPATLRVAAIRLPRVSNATDVDAFAHEPGVHVEVTAHPAALAGADLVVLPGSRATVADLAWLRREGLADAILRHAAAGKPVLGICGGMQMLGHAIADDVETGDDTTGLGLLPFDTRFHADKVLGTPSGEWRGQPVTGYEIHHGRPHRHDDPADPFPGGCARGNVWASMWHGTIECDAFRRAWLTEAARQAGAPWRPAPDAPGFGDAREAMIERLADAIEAHLDVDQLLGLAR
ncbi:cobyric acid synthase [uncultured Tessaracoccus sp.]|uniref:cobyric acid synthase n=1 Tax=uncultured Tessaracoccus sp. TaxID=905023 RepID=UPI0025E1DDFD|nr:cobyric acid synthase [uncultured Tessaracoccus sp.]